VMQDKIANAVQAHVAMLEETVLDQKEDIAELARRLVEVFHQGGRLLVVGSGALGAVANHVANLFLHRLALDRPLLPALSLCHDVTLATALTRDGRPQEFFARQLRATAAPEDLVFLLGDAHRDEALEEALAVARSKGCLSAVLLHGKRDLLGDPPDFLFRLRTDAVPRAIEGTLFFGHLLCELVESELFGI
jgi:D-sedoheptulose 7-phosphate isomerase